MKKTKGFTLVELVIVIVIVGILSVVAVPIYRGYTRKAMATEGKALLGAIQTSEKVYYAEYAEFFDVAAGTKHDETLDVDARANKYFKDFSVDANATQFVATVTGAANTGATNITLTLTGKVDGEPVITESGL